MIAEIFRATPEIARVSIARHVAYRAEMTIWILTSTLPLIMLALWNAVAEERGSVGGIGPADMARYFAATLIVRQLTGVWLLWELNFEIRSGRLSSRLLRPFPVLWPYAVWMVTAIPFRAGVLAPIIVGLALWRPDLLVWPGGPEAALFAASVVLAFAINFLMQACFGALSFWVDKTDGLFGVWFALWSLLSGYVAPLSLLPAFWRDVSFWLPFRAMLATPVELLSGQLRAADAGPAVAAQIAWLGAFSLLFSVLWRRGLARYGAFGA